MKKLLFIILFAALGCSMLQAMRRVNIKKKSWRVTASTRAPIESPFELYYEGNMIYIYANIDVPNLEVEVKDTSGKTVYSDFTHIKAGEESTFTLENVLPGEYTLEIKSGENYIIGWFMI